MTAALVAVVILALAAFGLIAWIAGKYPQPDEEEGRGE